MTWKNTLFSAADAKNSIYLNANISVITVNFSKIFSDMIPWSILSVWTKNEDDDFPTLTSPLRWNKIFILWFMVSFQHQIIRRKCINSERHLIFTWKNIPLWADFSTILLSAIVHSQEGFFFPQIKIHFDLWKFVMSQCHLVCSLARLHVQLPKTDVMIR